MNGRPQPPPAVCVCVCVFVCVCVRVRARLCMRVCFCVCARARMYALYMYEQACEVSWEAPAFPNSPLGILAYEVRKSQESSHTISCFILLLFLGAHTSTLSNVDEKSDRCVSLPASESNTHAHTPAHARTHLFTRVCTGTHYQVSITEWDAFAADGDAPLAQTTSRESSEHSRQSSRHPLQSPPHSPLPIPRFPPSSWVEHVPMRAASSDDDVAQQVRRSQPVCASEIFVCLCV